MGSKDQGESSLKKASSFKNKSIVLGDSATKGFEMGSKDQGESSLKKASSFKNKSIVLGDSATKNSLQPQDMSLENTRARLSDVLRRHGELNERLIRGSIKMVYDRLEEEFDNARAAATEEKHLDGTEWNDGLLATIRQRVHIEAERKAMPGDAGRILDPHIQGNIIYIFGPKVICCLGGARIGIQYETSFAGQPCELYHCVLESKSFLEKMTVTEHTLPFFLPIQDAEIDLLPSNAMKFIDYVGELVQAFVDRREQVCVFKELYEDQIDELYQSLSYHVLEFVLNNFECKVTVSIRYADLLAILPTRVRVLAWQVKSRKNVTAAVPVNKKSQGVPVRLPYAEDALRTMSLPEAYAEMVLNLPQALREISQ